MNYLFFDIECSNCFEGNGKMCEFGYVLTDPSFNIIKRRDIPMSPGRGGYYRFDNRRFRKDKYFERWYDEEEYFSFPLFPNYYDLIYELLSNKESMIFGFGVDNDIRYIDYTCKRYNLEVPRYIAIDIKPIIDAYKLENNLTFRGGLDDSFIHFYTMNEFIRMKAHKADNDAYMTMMVLKALLKTYNLSLNELIEKYPQTKLDAFEYINKAKERKVNKANKKKNRDNCQALWADFYHPYESILNNKENIGKRITLSSSLKKDIKSLEEIILLIKDKGYIPTNSVTKSDYFLVSSHEDIDRLSKALSLPYDGKMILLDEFKVL